MIKKKWDKPKLIVLVWSYSDQNILASCKHIRLGTGPNNNVLQCFTGLPANCLNCSTTLTS